MQILNLRGSGIVINQKYGNPDRGELIISGLGKPVINVSTPSVVGATLAAATATLAAAGLGITSSGGTGVVSSQSPVATTLVALGRSIHVVLA